MESSVQTETPNKSRRQRKGSVCVYRPRFRMADGLERLGSWQIKFSWVDDSGIKHAYDEKVPGLQVNKTVAGEYLKQKMGEAKGRTLVTGTEAENLTYENMREALIRNYRDNSRKSLHAANGEDAYIYSLKHLDTFFNGRKALLIRPALIEEFKDQRLREGAGNCSVNRALGLLRRMFSIAIDREMFPADREPKINMLREPPPRQGFIEHEQFVLLRQALPEHLRPVATLGFYTGMRRGEILGLRWENINLKKGMLRLEPGTTKNDEARVIPLFGELHEMFKILREKNPTSEFVFIREGMRMQSFRKSWNRSCIAAGLGEMKPRLDRITKEPLLRNDKPVLRYRGRTFHDLHRCGVSNLLQAGVDPYTARKISGHKSDSIFSRYNITVERHLKEAGSKVEAYFEKISQRQVKVEPSGDGKDTAVKNVIQ
jgi:integrase